MVGIAMKLVVEPAVPPLFHLAEVTFASSVGQRQRDLRPRANLCDQARVTKHPLYQEREKFNLVESADDTSALASA